MLVAAGRERDAVPPGAAADVEDLRPRRQAEQLDEEGHLRLGALR